AEDSFSTVGRAVREVPAPGKSRARRVTSRRQSDDGRRAEFRQSRLDRKTMSRLFYATLLALMLACAGAAQTRRGTPATTPARPRPAATTPAQTPTPKPAQSPASAPQQAAPVEDCGCEAGPLPDVLGAVNGVKITRADLS